MNLAKIEELEQLKDKEVLFHELAKQLNKDLNTIGEEVDFEPMEYTLNYLINRLSPLLVHLVENQINSLFTVLYTIDIPEEKVKRVLFEDSQEQPIHELAHLILSRAFQKVVLRAYFKSNKTIL